MHCAPRPRVPREDATFSPALLGMEGAKLEAIRCRKAMEAEAALHEAAGGRAPRPHAQL